MKQNIIPAQTKENYLIIEELAKIIWTEHYTPIIGEDQVSYMLEKFQSKTAVEKQIEEGMEYFLLMLQENPVGYFSFKITNDSIFLSKLYVLNSARGNGVGKKALLFIEEKGIEKELNKIRLTVNKYNSNSIKAYEKMGFKNIEAIVQDIGNGYIMDDYVLEKPLF